MSGRSSLNTSYSVSHLHTVLNYEDYAVYALPDFDPNDYANAVLAGEPYPQPSAAGSVPGSTSRASAPTGPKALATLRGIGSSGRTDAEDISVAIAKLTYSIEDVEKQIKNVVWTSRCCICKLIP